MMTQSLSRGISALFKSEALGRSRRVCGIQVASAAPVGGVARRLAGMTDGPAALLSARQLI
ncbi:hypothetical protein J6590_027029 [Homalodisca vitripennis]|nr:hypothetical protein J6590_027029 [Homalodisca vitripennis]